MTSSCCGHPAPRPRTERPVARLGGDPVLSEGIPMVYIGLDSVSVAGASSGLTYHLGRLQRRFMAHRDDVAVLVESSDIVQLLPGRSPT